MYDRMYSGKGMVVLGVTMIIMVSICLAMKWPPPMQNWEYWFLWTYGFFFVLVIGVGLLSHFVFEPDTLAKERLERGECPTCGYDLTNNISGRCPECGEKLTILKTERRNNA